MQLSLDLRISCSKCWGGNVSKIFCLYAETAFGGYLFPIVEEQRRIGFDIDYTEVETQEEAIAEFVKRGWIVVAKKHKNLLYLRSDSVLNHDTKLRFTDKLLETLEL